MTCIYQDGKNRVWFGTYFGKLLLAGAEGRSWLPESAAEDQEIRKIFEDKEGALWVLGETDLYRFEEGNFQPIGLRELLPDAMRARCLPNRPAAERWEG